MTINHPFPIILQLTHLTSTTPDPIPILYIAIIYCDQLTYQPSHLWVWEEAEVPRVNPCSHRPNVQMKQTHSRPGLNTNLCYCETLVLLSALLRKPAMCLFNLLLKAQFHNTETVDFHSGNFLQIIRLSFMQWTLKNLSHFSQISSTLNLAPSLHHTVINSKLCKRWIECFLKRVNVADDFPFVTSNENVL